MSVAITPIWPAPVQIKALTTTKLMQPGTDLQCEDLSLNRTEKNQLLQQRFNLPSAIQLLKQVHGTNVVMMPDNSLPEADASITQTPKCICTVMTADCLPILLCNRQGTEVAAIHAGWRGLCSGIITSTLQKMQSKPYDLIVWLGPAISQAAYEIGEEVREAFIQQNPKHAKWFINSQRPQHYYVDLYGIASDNLKSLGVTVINGGGYCTYSDQRFYSYRRGDKVGRMLSVIWIA